ncbi:DUF6512 family protein [Clostridium saccharoperbutylacetonicum]|uniref:DUF6512 family protein n=1 Tax=Clostridium saccharoperbutylacetonicum TaxID=36745 RepID=UPI000983E76B|nr:DUF6512 family protein [Clostridium saccharoperbutylacetonicum]AQR96059.1 hypothetical protein CLSAP_33770 [Clostridium saccharoperbutylacetonicum]NSB31928.1 hypothetical protein [Clostridium saccharoperbutylacetonicum]
MNNTIFKPFIWFLLGIPFIFLLGSFMHFAYDLSGKSTLIGIFAPVNESIWEHLKLSVYPTFAWFILGYLLFESKINIYNWFTSCLVSVIMSALIVVCFYYTYTGALGIHSLFLDIFSLFLVILIAQCLAFHIYTYGNTNTLVFIISLILSFIIFITFTKFTFSPPKFPIFMDPVTKQYGIQK